MAQICFYCIAAPFLLPPYPCKISADTQKERLLKRNPEKIEMFINKWIPLENQYFQAFDLFGQYPVLDATHIF